MKTHCTIGFNFLALLLLIPGSIMLGGCGEDNAIKKDDPVVAKKRLDGGLKLHDLYQKSKGHYEALSPQDQADMNAITGSEANSRTAFGYMGGTKGSGPK